MSNFNKIFQLLNIRPKIGVLYILHVPQINTNVSKENIGLLDDCTHYLNEGAKYVYLYPSKNCGGLARG